MAWDLAADRPIYAQLVERIQMQIVSGQYPPGARLPSVRELAAEAAVNPNTMQKAFAELERGGLILTQRTNGRSVTDDEELIQRVRSALAEEQLDHFFLKMKELGYTRRECIELLKKSVADGPKAAVAARGLEEALAVRQVVAAGPERVMAVNPEEVMAAEPEEAIAAGPVGENRHEGAETGVEQ